MLLLVHAEYFMEGVRVSLAAESLCCVLKQDTLSAAYYYSPKEDPS